MNTDFLVGFAWGFLTAAVFVIYIFSFAPKKPNGKKENDCWVNKPIIREEHFDSISVKVSEYVPLDK